MLLIGSDYPCEKKVSDNVYKMSQILSMGAAKTLQALLSFIVSLKAGLSGILTLKNNTNNQHFEDNCDKTQPIGGLLSQTEPRAKSL